jgi:hypothetical protein
MEPHTAKRKGCDLILLTTAIGIVFAIALFIFVTTSCGPLHEPSAEALAPKSAHTNIRMDSMEVRIRLKPMSYAVDSVFDLFNTGAATTEWIGCPIAGSHSFRLELGRWIAGDPFHRPDHSCLTKSDFLSFNCRVDGTKVETTNEPGWRVFCLRLPHHGRSTIHVQYEQCYSDFNQSYRYGSASSWKDSVGKIVLTVDGASQGGRRNFKVGAPGTWRPKATQGPLWLESVTENDVRYEINEYKPDPAELLRFY